MDLIFMKGGDSLAPTILFQNQSVLRANSVKNLELPTIAQLAERLTRNEKVESSILSGGPNKVCLETGQ